MTNSFWNWLNFLRTTTRHLLFGCCGRIAHYFVRMRTCFGMCRLWFLNQLTPKSARTPNNVFEFRPRHRLRRLNCVAPGPRAKRGTSDNSPPNLLKGEAAFPTGAHPTVHRISLHAACSSALTGLLPSEWSQDRLGRLTHDRQMPNVFNDLTAD